MKSNWKIIYRGDRRERNILDRFDFPFLSRDSCYVAKDTSQSSKAQRRKVIIAVTSSIFIRLPSSLPPSPNLRGSRKATP